MEKCKYKVSKICNKIYISIESKLSGINKVMSNLNK